MFYWNLHCFIQARQHGKTNFLEFYFQKKIMEIFMATMMWLYGHCNSDNNVRLQLDNNEGLLAYVDYLHLYTLDKIYDKHFMELFNR